MYLNKKLIAVAVSAACGLPLVAQAQTSVTVYGKLYPQINKTRVTGASAVGTPTSTLSGPATGAANVDLLGMESSNSRIGFRGTEDLGGGLKALFQLQANFGVDDGSLAAANTLFNMDTFVGMSGGFGTVKLGKMDTVYKSIGDTLSFLGISSGNFISTSNILSKQGFGTSNASRFHERRNNNIRYESPEIAGFQVLANYSLGEIPGSTSSATSWATGVTYEAGPVYLALAHERHTDIFGGSLNMPTAALRSTAGKSSKDTATRVTAQYKITGDTRVEANFARIELDESGAGTVGHFRNYKHNTWALGAEHKMGPWTLAASYGQAAEGSCAVVGASCSTAGLDGKQLNLGTSYNLSKRTWLYALYSEMKNGTSANYSNISGKPALGADIKQVALGINHNF